MAAHEHRRHLRYSVRYPATLSFPSGTMIGHIENIGEGGAFFVTDSLEETVAIEDRFVLEYRLEGEPAPRKISATVLRIDRYFQDGDLFRSLALRFETAAQGVGENAGEG